MAIQPQQARAAKERELNEKYKNIIATIEAGIDDQIRKWDGSGEVKYNTRLELNYYVTKELTARFHGWSVVFKTKDNKFTGWIVLTAKRETPSVPYIPDYPKPYKPWVDEWPEPWGGPYTKPKPDRPWDIYPKVTWRGPEKQFYAGY